jgi:hypothetical protein
MNTEVSVEKVWEAWKLSDDAWKFSGEGAREVPFSELFENFFAKQPDVDVERTRKQGDNQLTIFLKSPYALRYNPESKRWIPFRP